MAKEKAVNYTPELIEKIKAGYKGVDNKGEIEALSKSTGKSPASLRAKLASLGLYKATKAESEKGEKHTKSVIVGEIAKVAGLTELECEGLEKATKSALDKVLAALPQPEPPESE